VLTKPNGGKAAALNYALDRLTKRVYVGIDADTVIAADAISKLIPHFEDPRIGAMAGNAKVGNRVNLWTRWQALEYITSQNFERRALDLFHVVTVVPGAIGAWRTAPVKAAGGYPINTVAEDADLTMNLLEQGFKVDYEDRALAFTEAPIDAKGLMRQRFRWSFGTLQAIWKHRAAFIRNKAMGLFALPNILIFQMFLPLVSPFIDLMFLAGIVNYFIDRHYHPEPPRPPASRSCWPTSSASCSSTSSPPRSPSRWSAATPPTRATAGCSSTSGCSASPTARSSPSSSSRPSSAPSTASPSTGTSSSAPPK
jgi:peptidoglycan-N-acetylglucosamine deacetylase